MSVDARLHLTRELPSETRLKERKGKAFVLLNQFSSSIFAYGNLSQTVLCSLPFHNRGRQ